MMFSPVNFRALPADLPSKIRVDEGMTLISVKPSGAARYGRTRGDKGRARQNAAMSVTPGKRVYAWCAFQGVHDARYLSGAHRPGSACGAGSRRG
jgi:hypothetical protein